MSRIPNRPAIVVPTTAEDKAITAAAKRDPDALPMTPAQLKAMVHAGLAWPSKVGQQKTACFCAL